MAFPKSWRPRWTIGRRIATGFMTIAAFTTALGAYGAFAIYDASLGAERMRSWADLLATTQTVSEASETLLLGRGGNDAPARAREAMGAVSAELDAVPGGAPADARALAEAASAALETAIEQRASLAEIAPMVVRNAEALRGAAAEFAAQQEGAGPDSAASAAALRLAAEQISADLVRFQLLKLRGEPVGPVIASAYDAVTPLLSLVRTIQSVGGDAAVTTAINDAVFNLFQGFDVFSYSAPQAVAADAALRAAITALGDEVAAQAAALSMAQTGAAAQSSTRMALAVLIALALSGAASLIISRSLNRPIMNVHRAMARLADGDLTETPLDTARRDELGDMSAAVAVFRENARQVAELAERNEATQREADARRERMMTELQDAFGQVVDAAKAGDFSRRVEARFDDRVLTELADGVNGIVAGVDSFFDAFEAALSALAEGDLTQRAPTDRPGRYQTLARSANRTFEELADLVRGIDGAARSIDAASGAIAQQAAEVATRAEQQSATASDTAQTMSGLSQGAATTAETADAARRQVVEARQEAERGGGVVRDAREAMGRLVGAFDKIETIVGLIDDVAFQTNLLALNAAVEAARAGPAGKGFSVVAAEVRELAGRAAGSAKQIASVIQESAEVVRESERLVEASGSALSDLTGRAQDLERMVDAMSTANRDQAAGLSQINAALGEIEQTTQSTSRMTDASARVASDLTGDVDALRRAVAAFTLSGDATEAAGRAA